MDDDDEVIDVLWWRREEIRQLKRDAAWTLGLPMARNADVDRLDTGRVFNHIVKYGAQAGALYNDVLSRADRWRQYIVNIRALLDESTQLEDDGASVEGVEKKA